MSREIAVDCAIDEMLRSAHVIRGHVRDVATHIPTGRQEVWFDDHNVVCQNMGILLACLAKGEIGYSGISYWAIGSGDPAWDTGGLPVEDSTREALVAELGRKAILTTDITFLTEDLEPSLTPTTTLQVQVLFGPNDCNGTWREFGLFGGDATASADSGQLLNYRNHSIRTKDTEWSILRTVRFLF